MSRTTTRFAAIMLAALTSGAVAAPAYASGGGSGAVERTGHCSAGSSWDLKVKPDDGGLEIEFEVDSNVVGQNWQYRIIDNGNIVAQGTRTTTAPSGSFTVTARPANLPGADRVTGQARNAATGETCVGKVTLP